MAEKVVKTVKVSESKAGDWENYVDENPNIASISHLIRLSVHKEIEDGTVEISGSHPPPDTGNTGEILTVLRRMETSMTDLEQRLSSLESLQEAEASYNLQKAIYAILPEPDNPFPPEKLFKIHGEEPPGSIALSAEDIAGKLGANISDVLETVREMEQESGLIATATDDQQQVYAWIPVRV